MSEKKINIDLGLFNFSKTRKKRSGEKTDGIKIKQPSNKKKNDTLKKKSILKMIRQHQEDRYNNLFDKKKDEPKKEDCEVGNFNKDFEEAQKFMKNLTETTVASNLNKNKSIKNYQSTNSLLLHPSIDTFSNTMPSSPIKEVTNNFISPMVTQSPIVLNPRLMPPINPQYGCLKGGQLPTYRNYMNKTQKVMQPLSSSGGISNVAQKSEADIRNEVVEKKISESMNRVNEMKNAAIKLRQLKDNSRPKKFKRKKTVRRTYKLGKSKIHPKVAVLVSNKTIRSNVSTKAQLLKQVPIEDVKRHLIKCGLIKVGTIAPTDVLRKMYESSVLMCGDLENHNPENLLYNFVNGAK
jgi:hypothetical protein